MKFIPILFSTQMVKAILDGRKSQTRRMCKIQSEHDRVTSLDGKQKQGWMAYPQEDSWKGKFVKCPYGEPGDVLWVRETHYAYGHWTSVLDTETGKKEWHFSDVTLDPVFGNKDGYLYENEIDSGMILKRGCGKIGYYKRPSIHMPKAACRIWLRVKSVRVELLQEISYVDAAKEGVLAYWNSEYEAFWYENYLNERHLYSDPRDSFESLWISIHGDKSWDENPYVWVIEFERLTEKPKGF